MTDVVAKKCLDELKKIRVDLDNMKSSLATIAQNTTPTPEPETETETVL